MPATAREPSGTFVLVLCGQPLQNHGVRSPTALDAVVDPLTLIDSRLRSFASMIATRASMRAAVSASTPSFFNRLAIALAMIAGVRSACARSSQLLLGLGCDHSPPLPSAGSSNLPSTLGRTSGRQL